MRTGDFIRLGIALAGALLLTSIARADELVTAIQRDLTTLGYYTDEIDGNLDLTTQLAIGKFEEANGLPVTGEANLAMASKIGVAAQQFGATAPEADTADSSVDDEVVAAREQCLEQKKAEAEAAKEKKKLWGKIGKAGGNILGRFGASSVAGDLYKVSASADDVAAISDAMGLDEADVEECMLIGADAPATQ